MSIAIVLLAACSGGDAAKRWAEFPLSQDIDARQLAEQIKAAPEEWNAAADFLTGNDLSSMALGRYDLTPGGTYANVQEYDTRDSSKYEAHRDYIDVQVVVSGRERIFVSSLENLHARLQDYDPAKDIEFFAESSEPRSVVADFAHWVILFPSDAHMPCITLDEPSRIRKVVVKVPAK